MKSHLLHFEKKISVKISHTFFLIKAVWNIAVKVLRREMPLHFATYILLKRKWREGALPLSLYVTSACSLQCEHCIMGGLMKSARGYQMSLEEVSRFIRISEESKYSFDVVLTGGEPTAWRNLAQGVKLLQASSACHTVTMYTNAVSVRRFIELGVAEDLDHIRVSRYSTNEQSVDELETHFPTKISIVPRDEFWQNPDSPVRKSLPVRCLNPEVLVYNEQIYACPHSASIAATIESNTKICKPLEKNFLKGLNIIKFFQQWDICTRCISNGRVRKQLEKVPNLSVRQRRKLDIQILSQ